MAWAHDDLVGHMTLHLLIGMFAPLLWVLAAPMTLLLKTLPQAGGKWMVRFLHSRFMRLVTGHRNAAQRGRHVRTLSDAALRHVA